MHARHHSLSSLAAIDEVQGGHAKAGAGGTAAERPMDVEALHKAIRHIPKPVIAMVNGFAIGGGHVLHVLCDLSIASDTAIFGQTGPRPCLLYTSPSPRDS